MLPAVHTVVSRELGLGLGLRTRVQLQKWQIPKSCCDEREGK